MKKKAMALLLASAMVAGLLSGCGSAPAASAPAEAPKAEAPAKTEEAAPAATEEVADANVYVDEDGNTYKKFDDVQLTLLACWNGGYAAPEDQYNNEVAAAIREKIGVTVTFEGIMMSESEKLNMMFASGEMPDIVNAPYWGGTAGETAIIKKAGTEGRLIDIKPLLADYPNIADAYDIGVISKKYLENDIDINGGAYYVLPTEVSSSVKDKTNWAYGVFVREDVAKTLGVDPTSIKTSEELYDFMVAARDYGFKDVNGNDTIVATTFHQGWSYDNFRQSFNARKLTSYSMGDDGKITYDYLSENWIEKNLYTWKMVKEGILDKECFKCSDDQANEKVGNGTALFTCAQYGVTINATKLTGLYDSNPEMRYVPVGPLQYLGGEAATQIESEGRSGSPVIFFPSTCSNIEAALTYLDYVNSKEGNKLIEYGFEGDTYTLNADGQPRMTDELTARYNADSQGVSEELRARGIGYIKGRTYVNKKNTTWFGETAPFKADAENEYEKAYKAIRPIEILPGYAVDALKNNCPSYDEVKEWAFDSEKMGTYTERAYFADTEAEARKILEDYQNYLKTEKDGLFMQYLDELTEEAAKRDDIAY